MDHTVAAELGAPPAFRASPGRSSRRRR
jgi:hypothetical protein